MCFKISFSRNRPLTYKSILTFSSDPLIFNIDGFSTDAMNPETVSMLAFNCFSRFNPSLLCNLSEMYGSVGLLIFHNSCVSPIKSFSSSNVICLPFRNILNEESNNEKRKYNATNFRIYSILFRIPSFISSNRIIVPEVIPFPYFSIMEESGIDSLYSFAETSSLIASSSPELSIMPPTKSVFIVLVRTVIFFAQDNNANFPMPLRPMNGLPFFVFETLSFRFE